MVRPPRPPPRRWVPTRQTGAQQPAAEGRQVPPGVPEQLWEQIRRCRAYDWAYLPLLGAVEHVAFEHRDVDQDVDRNVLENAELLRAYIDADRAFREFDGFPNGPGRFNAIVERLNDAHQPAGRGFPWIRNRAHIRPRQQRAIVDTYRRNEALQPIMQALDGSFERLFRLAHPAPLPGTGPGAVRARPPGRVSGSRRAPVQPRPTSQQAPRRTQHARAPRTTAAARPPPPHLRPGWVPQALWNNMSQTFSWAYVPLFGAIELRARQDNPAAFADLGPGVRTQIPLLREYIDHHPEVQQQLVGIPNGPGRFDAIVERIYHVRAQGHLQLPNGHNYIGGFPWDEVRGYIGADDQENIVLAVHQADDEVRECMSALDQAFLWLNQRAYPHNA